MSVSQGVAVLRQFVIGVATAAKEAGQIIGSAHELKQAVDDAISNAPHEVKRLWMSELSTTDKTTTVTQTFNDLTDYEAGVAHADARPNQRQRTDNGAINMYSGEPPSYSNNHRRPQPQEMADGLTDGVTNDEPMEARAPGNIATGEFTLYGVTQ